MGNLNALYYAMISVAVTNLNLTEAPNPAVPYGDVLRLLIIYQDKTRHLPANGGLVDFINSTIRNPAYRLNPKQFKQYLDKFEEVGLLVITPEGYTLPDEVVRIVFPGASIPNLVVLDDLAEK